MSFIGPKPPIQGLSVAIERRRILDLAKTLRRQAEAMAMLDEIAAIISPPTKRKPGRQPGSASKMLADRRASLWKAYEADKKRSPNSTDVEIANRLYDDGRHTKRGDNKYGNSAKAILSRIAKIKSELNPPTLVELAGRQPRKPGRPKNRR